MNKILFHQSEFKHSAHLSLNANDYRAQHLQKILKAKNGNSFEAGIINTEITGKFHIENIAYDNSITGYFVGGHDPLQKLRWQNLRIGIGLTRPPVLKRLLQDFASAGIEEIALLQTKLCEGEYSKSHIWNKLQHYLILGAEQGRINRLPRLIVGNNQGIGLNEYLEKIKELQQKQIVLPKNCIILNEHGTRRYTLPEIPNATKPMYIICLGPERGWTANELQTFQDKNFTSCSFGTITLRTEVAAHLALGLYLLETQR